MRFAKQAQVDLAWQHTASLAQASPPRHPKHSPPAKQRAERVPNGTRRHSTPRAAAASADAAHGPNYEWQPKGVRLENGKLLTSPPTKWHAIFSLTPPTAGWRPA
jgi:hypothetical protein